MTRTLCRAGWLACLVATAADAQAPATPAATPAAPATAPATGAAKKPFYTNAALFTAAARPFGITRSDPALEKIISSSAKLESLGDRFGLTEGPTWIPDGQSGYLVVSDLIANVIYRIDPDGKTSVFLDKAGYSGDDINNAGAQTRRGRAAVLMIGPNGTTLDARGRLIWCAANDGTIVRLEKDGTRTVLASGYQGKRFDGPNDVVARSDGAVFLTDGDWGLRGGKNSPLKELPYEGVYVVQDGKVALLLEGKDLGGYPNGLALSPDERYLYLSSGPAKVMRYDLHADGTIGAGMVFAEDPVGFGDGMKTDRAGNLYSTSGAGPGVVRITSPEGKLLGKINLPVYGTEPRRQICATNVAFGDRDGKSLFIAACEAVYRIRLKTPGVVPETVQ